MRESREGVLYIHSKIWFCYTICSAFSLERDMRVTSSPVLRTSGTCSSRYRPFHVFGLLLSINHFSLYAYEKEVETGQAREY